MFGALHLLMNFLVEATNVLLGVQVMMLLAERLTPS